MTNIDPLPCCCRCGDLEPTLLRRLPMAALRKLA